MRTTLEIDDDVLDAARDLSRHRRQSLGQVISELARVGLRPKPVEIVMENGWAVIAPRGQTITTEMVRQALDDEA